MDAGQAKALRAPFPPEQIGKLPKPTKRENPKGKCPECGGWHGLPAVHLDYVSHAAATNRLLEVDPEWTWEPMARGDHGEPLILNGGLWINLTVCGVTRPGFGDDAGGKGMKEMIGDAIRNAAMRFGVALDLWAKEDLHAERSGEREAPVARGGSAGEAPDRGPVDSTPAEPAANGAVKIVSKAQRDRLWTIAKKNNVGEPRLREIVLELTGDESTKTMPVSKYEAVVQAVQVEALPFE